MNLKIIICGGGTMGHVTPALAILERIKELEQNAEILYITRNQGRENKIIENSGYNIKKIEIKGLDRKNILSAPKVFCLAFIARNRCINILKQFKPNIVIATGGYVCLPVLSAAKKEKIPYVIHESNAISGLKTGIVATLFEEFILSTVCEAT